MLWSFVCEHHDHRDVQVLGMIVRHRLECCGRKWTKVVICPYDLRPFVSFQLEFSKISILFSKNVYNFKNSPKIINASLLRFLQRELNNLDVEDSVRSVSELQHTTFVRWVLPDTVEVGGVEFDLRTVVVQGTWPADVVFMVVCYDLLTTPSAQESWETKESWVYGVKRKKKDLMAWWGIWTFTLFILTSKF